MQPAQYWQRRRHMQSSHLWHLYLKYSHGQDKPEFCILYKGFLCTVWNVPPLMCAQNAYKQPTCTWRKRGDPSSQSTLRSRHCHIDV